MKTSPDVVNRGMIGFRKSDFTSRQTVATQQN